MKNTDIKFESDHYLANQYQTFYVDNELVKEHLLKAIKFPVVIMDTEFFNRSHDRKKLKKNFIVKKNQL